MSLETQNLTKTYRFGSSLIIAVRSVNLKIKEGAFISILGPSGSGKTTLLNMLGLISSPTSGRILFDGEDMSKFPRKKRQRFRLMNVGLVFQSFNLIPSLSAQENVELPMALAGAKTIEQKLHAAALLKSVGLSHRRDHKPRQLSAGEMQRVSIARALANDPKIILADEPTGELDTLTGLEIIDLLLNKSKSHGKTLILATHDEKIRKVSDQIFEIKDGCVSQAG